MTYETRTPSAQYIHTALWGTLTGLALFRFRSRARFPTTILGVSAVSGYGFGLFHYFRQHRKFAQTLDDRQAFLLVLENVNKRLGNHGSLFPQLEEQKMLETIMKRKQENGEVLSPDVEFIPDSDSDSTTGSLGQSLAARSQPARGESIFPSSIRLSMRAYVQLERTPLPNHRAPGRRFAKQTQRTLGGTHLGTSSANDMSVSAYRNQGESPSNRTRIRPPKSRTPARRHRSSLMTSSRRSGRQPGAESGSFATMHTCHDHCM